MSFWRGREGYRREVESEIRHHLELRARELREQGLDADEAWRAAVEAFGDPARIESEVLKMRETQKRRRSIREALVAVGQDVRYAARFLGRNKLFAAVAIGTLALGIGANTAIFSLLDATLLREPEVRNPDSLVAVYTTCRRGAPRCSSSYPDYLDYRDRTAGLQDLAATSRGQVSLGGENRDTRLVAMEMVTGNYFSLLGVSAQLGRVLQPADDEPGAGASVVLLSPSLWRNGFGADPDVVGETVRLNGRTLEVVGVISDGYEGLTVGGVPDLWVPMQTGGALRQLPTDVWSSRNSRWMARLVGRLAPGATVGQARSELLAVSDGMAEAEPLMRGDRTVTVDALGRYLLPIGAEEDLPRFVWILVGVVAATLLLACANLANLLLARASARRGEIGVRIAIGAGRGRLVRQLLTESLLLSLLGGVVGLGVAVGLLRFLGGYELPGGLTISALGAGLDGRLLTVATGLAVATALLFGLVPAIRAARGAPSAGLHRGGSAGAKRGAGRLRRGLVAAQIALCFILLAGSGLFLRTLRSALDADLGFEARQVGVASFDLGIAGYNPVESQAFVEELRDRLAGDPRVASAGAANVAPFARGGAFMGTFTTVDGYTAAPDEEMRIDQVFTTPGYFETLEIPVLAGRAFGPSDSEGAEPVAIVNRSMAERYWPGGDAVGGILRRFGDSGPVRVVGVVSDVRWRGVEEEATNFVYFPRAQRVDRAGSRILVAARTHADPDAFLPSLRQEIQALDPDISLSALATVDEHIGSRLMPQRLGAVLLTCFGLLALILAAVGIVGVVSYTVREQRRAIGVRMALGAQSGRIVGTVLGGMAVPVALGLAVGLVGALMVDDAVAGFLYGVSVGDPLTYGSIALGLAAVALGATLVPAREASRVDPLQVLKAE